MSQNVTLFQIFDTRLRLPFIFGSGSERLSFYLVHFANWMHTMEGARHPPGRLVQWLGWVLETQERKEERGNSRRQVVNVFSTGFWGNSCEQVLNSHLNAKASRSLRPWGRSRWWGHVQGQTRSSGRSVCRLSWKWMLLRRFCSASAPPRNLWIARTAKVMGWGTQPFHEDDAWSLGIPAWSGTARCSYMGQHGSRSWLRRDFWHSDRRTTRAWRKFVFSIWWYKIFQS